MELRKNHVQFLSSLMIIIIIKTKVLSIFPLSSLNSEELSYYSQWLRITVGKETSRGHWLGKTVGNF